MAALSGGVKPVKKHGYEETTQGNTISKLRITLTSKNMKNFEKVSVDPVSSAKGKGIKVKGPVRMPTKTLRITTRKSPCGEGTSTWDRLELRTHKRVIGLFSTQDLVKQVTAITMEPGVDVQVMVADLGMALLLSFKY